MSLSECRWVVWMDKMGAESNSLAAEVRASAARVEASSRSNSKWHGLAAVLAESLGLEPEDVYVTTVDLVRNVPVRLTQSRPARRGQVGVVMWIGPDQMLERVAVAAQKACDEIPRLTLVFANEGSGMELVAIIKSPTAGVPQTLATAYPAASVMNF